MRISDWSSDVCSSDLPWAPRGATGDGKSSSLRSRPHPPFGHLLPQTGEGLQPILPRHAIALLLRSGRRWRAAPDEGASAASKLWPSTDDSIAMPWLLQPQEIPMHYRRLGSSGLQLSALSLAAWATFGYRAPRVDARNPAS